MQGALNWLFGSASFVPHGVCLLWRPDLVAIHVVSDIGIAVAYFAIPWAIWSFVRGRSDLKPEHRRMAVLFSIFIAACGLTHLVQVVTLWQPFYGLQAMIKAVTAVVSLITAVGLPPLVPKLLKVPSPSALQRLNQSLEEEVAAHLVTLNELKTARAGLERQVSERTEDLRVINARFETALSRSSTTVFEQDRDLRYTWIYNPPQGWGEDWMGRNDEDAFPGEAAAELTAVKVEALQTGAPVRREVSLLVQGERFWFDLKIQPIQLRDGGAGVICAASDITPQKRQQEQLQLVMRELNHRSKNLLTIVQSIARQSASGLNVPQDYLLRLSARLRSLAQAHDILVEADWRGADLRAVIRSQLKHQLEACPDRIHLTGEDFALPPESAHYLALAIHELGANATKYGALSGDRGEVRISWSVGGDGGSGLKLVWRETGDVSSEVQEPQHRGFGRMMLESLVPRALRGRAELRFAPDGVEWVLETPPAAGGLAAA